MSARGGAAADVAAGRGGAALPALAALLTAASRLPWAAHRLWDHDSIQFALAVGRFDLAHHHPHPPGYPLYVGLLKLLALAGVAPGPAMVGLAIFAEAVGAALIVRVAARLAADGRSPAGAAPSRALVAGLLAAALYATNPLLWFYGELPLVYAVEGGLTVALAWAALGMGDGRGRFLAACALFALAGGIRPSTPVLLAPLFLYGLVRARWPRRRGGWRPGWGTILGGAALGAACVLAWLVPLLVASGGLAAYRRISDEHFAALLPQTSILYGAGLPALEHNATVLVKWALQGLVPAVVVLAALALTAPRRLAAGIGLAVRRADWLAAWALPPILFFALFHVTKAGYTLIHLPALLVAAALVAAPALAARPGRTLAAVVAAVAAVAVGAGVFLFGADRRPDQPRWLAPVRHEFTHRSIATYEHDLDDLRAALAAQPRGRTLLATVELEGTGGAGASGFLYSFHRHLQWYAPDFPVAMLVPEQGFALVSAGGRGDFERVDGVVEVAPGIDRVVFVLAGDPGGRLRLPPGEVVLGDSTFRVVAVRLRGELRVGGVVLRPGAVGGRESGGPGERRRSGGGSG